MLQIMQNCLFEVSFFSNHAYNIPFTDVDMNVIFTGPEGNTKKVPAFWSGNNIWKIRFAGSQTGIYQYQTTCSDSNNDSLHNQTGKFEVIQYTGDNPLFIHGGLQMSGSRNYLEHKDSTPFFWLGDTWWMSLCKRLKWPEEFQALTSDRVQKGFTVIQLVAGLYPDMPPTFDTRGANEAGFPLSKDCSIINPDYFEFADLRIAHLIHSGLVPAIVGSWGYWILVLGLEKMKRFWKYLVSRWGAYPVVWCLAGEAVMPYYLSETREEDEKKQRDGWTEMASYVRQVDAFHNPITIHPTQYGREQINDPNLLDMEWLQTGHSGYQDLPRHVESVAVSVNRKPRLPVILSEANYEGILGHAWQDVQRFSFWSAMLSGACGYTYGANGIWQVNQPGRPFGPSPHGRSWGNTPWQEAAQLPGSYQLGLAAQFLCQLDWWKIRPHPEWVDNPGSKDNLAGPFSAGIPGYLRIIYSPMQWEPPRLKNIEPDITYSAFYFDPVTGKEIDLGIVEPDADNNWTPPPIEIVHDWVIILKKNG